MSVRSIIADVLESFERRPQRLEALLERAFSQNNLDQRDRRFVQEIVYVVVRRKLTLDFIIESFLSERLKGNAGLMRILRMGAYQIIYMDRIPDHAAVNETVNLAKHTGSLRNSSGVVNALLRNIIRNKAKLPQPSDDAELACRLSVLYSHPQWLVERWLKRFGLAKTKSLMEFYNTRPAIYFRRKIRGLGREQFDAESRGICDAGRDFMNLFYRLRKTVAPENIILMREGHCTVQAPSSGWVVAMCSPRKGSRVLDVCSAPGGKTSLISELVGRHGAVCSCDIKPHRLNRVAETVERMSLENIYLIACDGSRPPFIAPFDTVLLDAPCSATGVLHRHPDGRWRLKPGDFERFAALQSQLLDGACTMVAPKGVLVYSTCSIEPRENAEQVKSFLSRHPDFVLERAPSSIPDTYISLDGCLEIMPHEHKIDGMFAARFRRKVD